MLHVGQFSQGLRNGPAVVASSMGERFEGHFLDDILWGPGLYTYMDGAAPPLQPPSSNAAADADRGLDSSGPAGAETAAEVAAPAAGAGTRADAAAVRVAFRGMMNGRPLGKGCMTWSDGRQQLGQVWRRMHRCPHYSCAACCRCTVTNCMHACMHA